MQSGKKRRVLITGGLGTISRYLTEELDRQGHEVVLLNHHEKDVSRFQNVRTVVCDRGDHEAFVRTCRELGPFDCVYDMICYDIPGARSAVDAFGGRVKQYVFCSTVDVYDKTGYHYPMTEDAPRNPSPEHPYAYRKKQAEDLLMEAHRAEAFQVTILRPAHTYAENSPKSHLLFGVFRTAGGASYHLDRIRKGRPIILHGDGQSVWNITHGSDTGAAFAGALCNPKAYGRAYTVCGDECMSTTVMWDAVAKEMGAPPIRYVHIPAALLRRLEPELALTCFMNYKYNNVFDNAAAKDDLGLVQRVPWAEGIRRCLQSFGEVYDSCDKPEYAFYDRLAEAYEQLCDSLVERLGR